LLCHIGRRTGRRRKTVLEVVEYRREAQEAIVMSGFGPGAQWLRNLEAGGDLEVTIAGRRFAADYRLLSADEATQVLTGYLRRYRFIAPIIRLVLGRLLGWRFDGSPQQCRRAVMELPLIGFRPATRAQHRP
jgi:deazaflavin-dependent oxidoreductase (nitroreductase family)